MNRWFRLAVSATLGAAIFFLLRPSVLWLAMAPAVLIAVVIWIATGTSRRTERLREYAIAGFGIGGFVGGVGTFLFVLITGYGATEGWEGLIAVVSGMLGAFSGAVVGLAIGIALSFNRGGRRE